MGKVLGDHKIGDLNLIWRGLEKPPPEKRLFQLRCKWWTVSKRMYVWEHIMHSFSREVGADMYVVFEDLKGQCGWSSGSQRAKAIKWDGKMRKDANDILVIHSCTYLLNNLFNESGTLIKESFYTLWI